MENFKAAIFTKRVIAFNESFVPTGLKGCIKKLAILWHEGIQGRKQEDLKSCFRVLFFTFQRHEKNNNLAGQLFSSKQKIVHYYILNSNNQFSRD